jgi:hypothetical protein
MITGHDKVALSEGFELSEAARAGYAVFICGEVAQSGTFATS